MITKRYIGEVWRPVRGYEGLYEVSNYGRVRNSKTGRIRKPVEDKDGYLTVILSKKGKVENKKIHRLVAEAFIPVPDHLKDIPFDDLEVNHKKKDRTDNRVEHLEWCTHVYNCNFGDRVAIITEQISLPILQYTLENEFVREYPSIREMERQTGYDRRNITKCLKRKIRQSYGFIWRYKNKRDTE